MYLLVIVTLVIGILSMYAQVLSVEAARFAANQTGFVKTMLAWHSGAVSMAAKIAADPAIFTAGFVPCSLTFVPPTGIPGITTTIPAGLPVTNCPAPAGLPLGTITDGSSPPVTSKITATDDVRLPEGYRTDINQFYSVLYRDGTQPYVVTFAFKPTASAANPAPGYIVLPPTNRITSVTMSNAFHQFDVARVPIYLYGGITSSPLNSILTTVAFQHNNDPLTGTPIQYTIPLTGLDGAIGVASSAAGF